MSHFTSVHVTGSGWREVCDRALADSAGTIAGQLAFVYLSDDLAGDCDRVIDYLREHSSVPHWVGCIGMGLCSTARETYGESGLCALFTPFVADHFRVIPDIEDGLHDWLDATQDWRTRQMASVAVVHADPASTKLPQTLMELSEGLQGGFLVGGIASAETLPIQIADRATGGHLSGVLFSSQVAINTGLSQGCSLIGQRHRITRCQRNIIETIDDRPALDVFKEAIGETLARDLHKVGGYIFAALPIAGSDTGDYMVRNLVGIDLDRGLVAIGDVPEVDQDIQFARRDAESARADLQQMIEGLLKRLPAPPRGALYHSCLGRGRNLFGEGSAEMLLVQDLLGDVPLAGFYANGEISHNRLYGYTGVLTLFS